MELRDQRHCNWYWMDKAVYLNNAKTIGLAAFAVYNALCAYSNCNKCWPSMQTVSEKLGVSRKSVSRALKTLELNGLIKIESGQDTGNPNIYTLLNIQDGGTREIEGYDNLDTVVGQIRPARVGHYKPSNNNNTTIIKNNNVDTIKDTENNNELPLVFNFDLAYNAYPRKLGRADAERHFKAQVKTSKDMEDLLLAIDNYKAHITLLKTEEQYIKHASSFFNKNWRDWIDRKPIMQPEVKRYNTL